jgi:hypothetical protein
MTHNSDHQQPLTFGEPVEITSKPGTYKGIRNQRVRLGHDVWVTVHEDGRIGLASNTQAFALTFLIHGKDGSHAMLSTKAITGAEPSGEAPPEDPAADAALEP